MNGKVEEVSPPEAVRAHSADGREEEEGRADDEIWVENLPPNHLLTHLPKSHLCDTCRQAKLHEAPHRRRGNQREVLRLAREAEDPTAPLERIAVDFVIARDLVGQTGDKVALVLVDRFSGLIGVFPSDERSGEEAMKGLQHFCGTKAPGIVEVSSDRERGILRAVEDLGFVSDPSPPNMDIKNPYAESAIRTLKGSASSLLLHAGMDPDLWPLAVKYFEFAHSVNTISHASIDPPVTCFEAFHGYPYEGYLIPFGSLVWFREPGGKSFEPRGQPALYLGAELINGMKYKGNHRVWPLDYCLKGVLREYVVRTLAFPNGKWQFPLKTPESPKESIHVQELEPPADLEEILQVEEEKDRDHRGKSEPGTKGGEPAPKPKDDDLGPKKRNRAITVLRIGVHGRTRHCLECSEGTYSHTKECRDRFNKLIDLCEPLGKDKDHPPTADGRETSGKMAPASRSSEPAHGAVKGGEALEVGELSDGSESCDYAPTSRTASPLPSSIGDPDDLGDPNELEHGHMFEGTGAMIASGKKISDVIHTFERGSDVVASIFFDALEKGGVNEESPSMKLAKAMAAVPKPKVRRQRAANATCWFVEFCCSKDSALKRIANEQGISYIGLSKDLDDLSDPNDMNQVMMWAHERKDLGGSIHLRGSLPCTAWCSWQHLNRRVLDAGFQDDLVNRRQESKLLVSNFSSLTDVVLESGASSTFEWPRWCSGWTEVEELQDMITKHSMISAYPCGCAFDLTIHGKKPLKPWRLVTTNERVAVEMNNKVCKHPKGHKHDRLEGGKLS